MNISSVSSGYSGLDLQVKPSKPTEPIAPPGGNIENRQPPTEPIKPAQTQNNEKGSALDISV